MNETWGPPIRGLNGNVLSPCKGAASGPMIQTNKLSPQYSNRRRRGNTPPEESPIKKKLKKQHRRLTSPGSDDINCVRGSVTGTAASAGAQSESTVNKKKLVLLPPKLHVPDGRTCVYCHKARRDGRMRDCMKCDRPAYCSMACRSDMPGYYCSSICQTEDERENERKRRDSSELSSPSSPPELESDEGSPPYEPDEEDDRSPPAPPSPEHDEGTELDLRNEQEWDIVDFRISKNGRMLIYELISVDSEEVKSLPAKLMQGEVWTERINLFWEICCDKEGWKRRHAMENPFGDVTKETGTGLAREIWSARIDDGRYVDFNTRNFERYEPDDEGDCTLYEQGSTLGPE